MIFVGLEKSVCLKSDLKPPFSFTWGKKSPPSPVGHGQAGDKTLLAIFALNYSCYPTVPAEYHIEMCVSYTKSISTLTLSLNMYFSANCQSRLSVITVLLVPRNTIFLYLN